MAASRGTAAGCPEVRWPMRSVRCPCSYDPKDAQQRTPGGARDLPEVSLFVVVGSLALSVMTAGTVVRPWDRF